MPSLKQQHFYYGAILSAIIEYNPDTSLVLLQPSEESRNKYRIQTNTVKQECIIFFKHAFEKEVGSRSWVYNFSDKELHFIVIGLLGMAFVFIVYPVFKWLAKHNHVMVIAWIYVFTLILVITFAIEIGQKVTNTGAMEFADIVFGVVGFIVMFFIFSIVREIYHLICRLIKYLQNKNWGK